ncbi:hypothetical protein JNW91_00465 [Micromonospora sp. STR1_7]|uniref:Uncharacterized protein n=1 Tax=Micromonospora parastrephiae TaxID=2806101 RepID=A0ABS1XMI7_9ACTN|nr:hypothetical protein [Micromonospora parastrephiae]MBM0230476.1 hypothetical protein [Micromonospora parastrephiae]
MSDLAVAADQPDVLAWAHATQNLIANHTSDPQGALNDAACGLGQVGEGPYRVRVVISELTRHWPPSAMAATSTVPPEVSSP